MRLRRGSSPDPGKPHVFVPRADPGLPAAAAGAFMRAHEVTSAAVTSAYLRDDETCGLNGCGRPRKDDVHAVAGD